MCRNSHDSITIYSFKTKRFTVLVTATPEYEADLSDMDDADASDILAKLESGELGNYVMTAMVKLDGTTMGSDMIGGCIYENPSEFRDHVGSKGEWGSYFTDMVHAAIAETRHMLRQVPRMRQV